MKLIKKFALAAFLLGVLQGISSAGEVGVGYGMVSTNGMGLGYAKSIGNNFALRGQINALPKINYSGGVGDFGGNSALVVDASWRSFQLVGDWYPSDTGIRLSAGLVVNKNKIHVSGKGEVNGVSANVDSVIDMAQSGGVSPYIGIGYSTRPINSSGWGLVFDLGVMRQNPKASLIASGAGITAADVTAQAEKINQALRKLRNYPVVGIGLGYAF
jgi:hypothetical protein